jgi:hypothetical protein
MPLLAALWGVIATAITSFLTRVLAGQVGFKLLALGAFAVLAASMVAFFNAAISPLAASVFNTQYGQLLGLAFPPVAGSCIATLLGAIVFAVAYRLKMQFLRTAAGAS